MDSSGGNFLNVVHLVHSSHVVSLSPESLVKKTSENKCLLQCRALQFPGLEVVSVWLVFLEPGNGSAPWEQIA